ncbi:MAG: hypothetical protein ABIH39_06705, partial [Candidatus Margulisiibacteriota bacterium]
FFRQQNNMNKKIIEYKPSKHIFCSLISSLIKPRLNKPASLVSNRLYIITTDYPTEIEPAYKKLFNNQEASLLEMASIICGFNNKEDGWVMIDLDKLFKYLPINNNDKKSLVKMLFKNNKSVPVIFKFKNYDVRANLWISIISPSMEAVIKEKNHIYIKIGSSRNATHNINTHAKFYISIILTDKDGNCIPNAQRNTILKQIISILHKNIVSEP